MYASQGTAQRLMPLPKTCRVPICVPYPANCASGNPKEEKRESSKEPKKAPLLEPTARVLDLETETHCYPYTQIQSFRAASPKIYKVEKVSE